jgi:hypothetical protein
VAREDGPAARPAGTAALRGRGGWSLRLVLALILLAVAVYTVTALLTLSWSERRADAIAEARAVALGQWLATEASLAIRTGGDVGQAVTRLARESGVKDAVIIRPEDGRIMAPSSRANESVDKLPGLGVAPAEVWRSQAVREGGLVEVVTPVATPGGPRGAVAWLRFQPSAADGGSSLVVLVPALLLAFGLALGVATVIRRNTERSLAAFNEDVELAVSGRLNQVADPMGVKPLKDLAETLNYLLVRVRGSERGGARPGSPPGRMGRDMSADPPAGLAEDRPMVTAERPGAPHPPVPAPRGEGGEATGKLDRPHEAQPGGLGRPVPPAASGPPAAAVPPAPARALPPAVRMVASAAYRVTEVGPECAGILDVRPEAMVGQHLLDAVPDKRVVDAVLRCLSTLPPAGEERTTVELAGKDYQLDVAVRRAGRDQPITIVLTPTESRVP